MEFRLTRPKRDLFLKCIHEMPTTFYRKVGQEIYIQMNWERLILFGSDAQIKHFNKIRDQYVNQLLKKHVQKIYQCNVELIGSKSPKSDIDINLVCDTHFQEVFQNIYKDHRRQYPTISLSELFDVNIYGTVYHYLTPLCDTVQEKLVSCYPRRYASYIQRQWSFLRIVEVLEKTNMDPSFPIPYQRLYKDTLQLLKFARNYYKHHTYDYTIKAYHDLLKETRPKATAEAIGNAFSIASFIELESYRSVGAVLHIVEKLPNIPKTVLYDSIYDNLGFIYQILLGEHLCVSQQTLVLFVKTCKYIERITHAMMLIQDKPSKHLIQLHKQSNDINLKRKQMVAIPSLENDVKTLIQIVNLHELSKIDFVKALTQFILEELPKDPLLKSHV